MNIQELRELAEEFAEIRGARGDFQDAEAVRDFLRCLESGELARHRSERAIRWFKATGRLLGELRT